MRAEIGHHNNDALPICPSRATGTARCFARGSQLEASPASASTPGAGAAEDGRAGRCRVHS